jgi:tol-pal system protein YbgF
MAMTRLNTGAVALIAAGTLILGCSLGERALAQDYGAPPADVGSPGAAPNGPDAQGNSPDAAPPGGSSDEASLLLRVERLEEQLRDMNGQIEQMQFENHKLEDQLRKFQEDVDFRFQEGHGRPLLKREDTGSITPPVVPAAPAVPAAAAPLAADVGSAPTPEASRSRSDAFDPSTDPNAPGAPRPLGSTPPSAPLAPAASSASAGDSDAPIDLPSSGFTAAPAAPAGEPQANPPAAQPQSGPAPIQPQAGMPASPIATPGGTVIASAEVNPTKEEFDVALGYFKQRDYDDAEKSFSAFLEKNPKNRFTSDALYYLGETYYQRGRQREAAEQYLKISEDYASSPRAPEAMLRLGESLQALGAKEQACATFSEVPHKYPNASAAVKAGAEREAKRAQC